MWKIFLYWLGVPCPNCPYIDDDLEKRKEREWKLTQENSYLRSLLEREGISYGNRSK